MQMWCVQMWYVKTPRGHQLSRNRSPSMPAWSPPIGWGIYMQSMSAAAGKSNSCKHSSTNNKRRC